MAWQPATILEALSEDENDYSQHDNSGVPGAGERALVPVLYPLADPQAAATHHSRI